MSLINPLRAKKVEAMPLLKGLFKMRGLREDEVEEVLEDWTFV